MRYGFHTGQWGLLSWPPFQLPLVHLVALNLFGFFFAEEFGNIMHANEQGI